jgi:hypothetical protein
MDNSEESANLEKEYKAKAQSSGHEEYMFRIEYVGILIFIEFFPA